MSDPEGNFDLDKDEWWWRNCDTKFTNMRRDEKIMNERREQMERAEEQRIKNENAEKERLNKMSVEDRERHHKEKKEMVSKFRRAAAKSTIIAAAGDAASMARMAVQNEIKEGALESSGAKGEAWYKAGKAIKNHEAVSILSGDGFPVEVESG